MHKDPVKEYAIRDKVFYLSLYEYGEGEPPFKETIILADTHEHAHDYYLQVKNDLPKHQAISIRLSGE